MVEAVPAEEFARHIERYREQALTGPVPVSAGGTIAGYFISPNEYETLRFREGRRTSFATEELSEDLIEAIASSRMDARHARLDAMLDPE